MDRTESDRRRFLRQEYISRINRVIDHVDSHLEGDLCLDSLAGVAGFSPFHFHRIFRAITGETLNRFIQRLRVEKAARQLLANRRKTITEIALDCGFSSSASFARAFKEAFGMSATQWRNSRNRLVSKAGQPNSKISKPKGKACKDSDPVQPYLGDKQGDKPKVRRNKMKEPGKIKAQVEVKNLPEMEVAYIRYIGAYQGLGELFAQLIGKLMAWAGPRGLLQNPEARLMNVYHDDPEVTEAEKLRTSICLTVPPQTEAEGEIGRMTLPGGQCALASFELDQDQFQAAWDAIYGGWLPESGYQPDDRPPFEFCKNDPTKHPQGKYLVDICVPVKPM